MGNLSLEVGLTLPFTPAVKKGDIPNREQDCILCTKENDPIIAEVALRAPVNLKFPIWVLKGMKDGMLNDRFGLSIREMWLCRADGKGFDVLSLVALCDFVSAAPSNFSPGHADLQAGLLYATLSMTTEIKSDLKGAKWLYMRARAHAIRNGRFDTEVLIFDEDGELVAISKHVSVVVEGPMAGKEEEIRRLFKL